MYFLTAGIPSTMIGCFGRELRTLHCGLSQIRQWLPLRRCYCASGIRFLHEAEASESSGKHTHLERDAIDMFDTAVSSVLPRTMVTKAMTLKDGNLVVDEQTYPLRKNVHIVAFGKAVLGMVRAAEDTLGKHVVGGIASVPTGIRETLTRLGKWDMLPREASRVRVMEGAANNMPDVAAHQAAMQIHDLVSQLDKNDLVLTLISGGGSALLPAPVSPITLEEMAQVTRVLSKGGATIQQLNTVRKQLELLKGGGLAAAAHPAQVISLILSDVIGDPLDFIASGPTVRDHSTSQQCLNLFHGLDVEANIPKSVIEFLQKRSLPNISASASPIQRCKNAQNVIVGSNRIAIEAACERAKILGYIPFVLSLELDGEARDTGALFVKIAAYICSSLGVPQALVNGMTPVKGELDLVRSGVPKDVINQLRKSLDRSESSNEPLCIIAGGETTVNVKGAGKGGRNQEMALAAAIAMEKNMAPDLARHFKIQFLSAGTDGEDGPTSVAGAFADQDVMRAACSQGLEPQRFLEQNDSFTFFSKLNEGRNLVVTGLTGTNVMDIQMLLIKPLKTHYVC